MRPDQARQLSRLPYYYEICEFFIEYRKSNWTYQDATIYCKCDKCGDHHSYRPLEVVPERWRNIYALASLLWRLNGVVRDCKDLIKQIRKEIKNAKKE